MNHAGVAFDPCRSENFGTNYLGAFYQPLGAIARMAGRPCVRAASAVRVAARVFRLLAKVFIDSTADPYNYSY